MKEYYHYHYYVQESIVVCRNQLALCLRTVKKKEEDDEEEENFSSSLMIDHLQHSFKQIHFVQLFFCEIQLKFICLQCLQIRRRVG